MGPFPVDFDYRQARRARWLRTAALWIGLACAISIVVLNLFQSPLQQWTIVGAAAVGTLVAAILSASVFWSYSIGLLPWILMFVIHGTGMAFALHGIAGAKKGAGLESELMPAVLMLAFVLAVTLLLRGAVLLHEAQAMPNWLVSRKHDGAHAIPKLWLFILCWLSPLAWCVAILTLAPKLFPDARHPRPETSIGFNLILILCIAVITARTALSLVVAERSRHGNWIRQKPQPSAITLSCCGFVSLYACVYLMAFAQIAAAADVSKQFVAEARAELKALQPPELLPAQNAYQLYKLADGAYVAPGFARTS